LNPTLFSSIKHFVRGELGCTCPDEVFATMEVQHAPCRFEGLPGDCLIVIGQRLLVLLIDTGHWQDVSRHLESLVSRGRELRDAEGFNRIRFVVATPDNEAAEPVLMEQFGAVPSLDDRMHLHIITPEGVPVLFPETEGRVVR
jgi:hypothetical protein